MLWYTTSLWSILLYGMKASCMTLFLSLCWPCSHVWLYFLIFFRETEMPTTDAMFHSARSRYFQGSGRSQSPFSKYMCFYIYTICSYDFWVTNFSFQSQFKKSQAPDWLFSAPSQHWPMAKLYSKTDLRPPVL